MELPKDKKILLENITNDLKQIDGVKAIVLGGSYATGRATANSDLDIGIYYSEDNPFSLDKIKSIAEKYSDNEVPTVTDFYEWGPWINGGAWIRTVNGKVDFLYKNIEQIVKTTENAKNGILENHFEQQPPYGFSSLIFLAETFYNKPLHDPEDIIYNLKKNIEQYPQKLKQSVVQQSLWSAEFTIWQARDFASKVDIYCTVGCFTRAIKNLVTALFAINELYPIGDKNAISILEQSKIKPEDFSERTNNILCTDKQTLSKNVELLKSLFNEIVQLSEGMYKPIYDL